MLTLKQEKYIQELIKGKSQREAYKIAYDAENMSNNTIDHKASLLFQKGELRARYEELRRESEDKAADDATTIRAQIIDLYRKIAFSDPREYYVVYSDKFGNPAAMLRPDFLEYDGAPVKSISFDNRGNLKLEFYDRTYGAEKLREMYGLEPETKEEAGIEISIPEDYAR